MFAIILATVILQKNAAVPLPQKVSQAADSEQHSAFKEPQRSSLRHNYSTNIVSGKPGRSRSERVANMQGM